MSPDTWLVLLICLGLLFDFLNGFHDSANVVATLITSRAMSSRKALLYAALAEFAGPFLFGVAVATTVGSGVVIPEAINVQVIATALFSACIWNLFTWYYGIPSSSSHALIGGIIGAVIAGSGFMALQQAGLKKILIVLLTSPLIGLIFGYFSITLVKYLLRNSSPRAEYGLKVGQFPAAMILALSHGSNDAQKTMGILTLGLMVSGHLTTFAVPWWVIVISSSAIAAGTAFGGWRIIRTLGSKFYRIKPLHSFSSQLASALVILLASILGGPVSTTHVVSMSIMGAGAGDRISKVRWLVLKDIAEAWVITIPTTALLAVPVYLLLQYFTNH